MIPTPSILKEELPAQTKLPLSLMKKAPTKSSTSRLVSPNTPSPPTVMLTPVFVGPSKTISDALSS